jgi:protein-tyrosine-phosphatase
VKSAPHASPKENTNRKKVLFICMGNACRSPMAESIARRDGTGIMDPFSAGVSPLGSIPSLTTQTLANNNYPCLDLTSDPITREAWDSADLVINMSGIPKHKLFFDSQKVEDWNVPDPYGADPAVYQTIFEDIRRRVDELAARLRKAAPDKPPAST